MRLHFPESPPVLAPMSEVQNEEGTPAFLLMGKARHNLWELHLPNGTTRSKSMSQCISQMIWEESNTTCTCRTEVVLEHSWTTCEGCKPSRC